MGLILEDKRFAVLSDILGDEDHLGDMDFKVAGTEQRHHLAADGHQDRRHHRGDHAGRARPGEGRPHAHPRRDGARRSTAAARRARRARAAHRGVHDPDRQDPRSDRHRRQGDPRDRREDRRQDRHRGRRHREGRLGQRASRSRRRSTGSSRSPPSPRSATIYEGTVVKVDGLRRLRELLRRQGRPRAHHASWRRAACRRPPTWSRKATR